MCGGNAHAQALSWIDGSPDGLGQRGREAWQAQVIAQAVRQVADSGRRVNEDGKVVPFRDLGADAIATQAELQAAFRYANLRVELIDRLFGIYREYDGKPYKVWSPAPSVFENCLVQCCCGPCARCQETDTLMEWRNRHPKFVALNREVRFGNPFACECGFVEYVDGIKSTEQPLPTPKDLWLTPENLVKPENMRMPPNAMAARNVRDWQTLTSAAPVSLTLMRT